MKKTSLAAIIAAISISLVGCTNGEVGSNVGTGLNSSLNNLKNITIEQAKEIALKHAGLTMDQVSFLESENDVDNGLEKYDIQFSHDGKEYDYEISLVDGSIIQYDNEIETRNGENNNKANSVNNKQEADASVSSTSATQNSTQSNTSNISVEKAKEIALSHAGLSSNQVTFVQAKSEYEHGIQKYEIEFYCNGTEYDYDINATNGQILSYDHDMEHGSIPTTPSAPSNNNSSSSNTTTQISAEKAKEIALSHAGVSSSQVAFIQVKTDYDHGVQKYEVEFYCNGTEYDYEINAANGQILSYDYDMEHNYTPPTATPPSNNQSNSSATSQISVEEAKQIALSHAGLASNQVTFKKAQLHFDDGIQQYEVEFYYNHMEYSYEINASNGAIISYEQD